MKAALIQCPVWWTVDPPLGLAQIAGCLSHAGHEVSVFDLNIELAKKRLPGYENLWNWEQFQFWNHPGMVARFFRDNAAFFEGQLERILRTEAGLIGFSVYNGSQLASLELARRIKRADARRKIVFGGQYLFLEDNAESILSDPTVDAVVRGPGDEVFPEMAAALEKSGELPVLPGTTVRTKEGLKNGGPVKPLRDLDSVPFADFSGFPLGLYDVQERLPIHGSRGCVWQCHFCSSHPFWTGYSYMGGDRLFAELMEHKRRYPCEAGNDFRAPSQPFRSQLSRHHLRGGERLAAPSQAHEQALHDADGRTRAQGHSRRRHRHDRQLYVRLSGRN
ncbi:MAG: cobalamin B12-binding domain-containing protein [Elusimicrobia bacterium]|nr:cobalamin B12-binding domain-containing protein [Elusimicrobiota bacterium]